MSSKKWTKNPSLPKRYRPGKGEDAPSDDEYSEDEVQQEEKSPVSPPKRPATTSTRPPRPAPQAAQPAVNEEDFETESEDETKQVRTGSHDQSRTAADGKASSGQGESDSESGSEEESDDDDDDSEESSEEEAPKLIRPTFIRKEQRAKLAAVTQNGTGGDNSGTGAILSAQSKSQAPDEVERRKTEADLLVQEHIERQIAARAAGRKYWDDDDDNLSEEVDDTDGIDPEAELAAWKLRELKRVKRARDAIEAAEKEREEIERRRNLTAEEREKEDAEHLGRQHEERGNRAQSGYMQKYFHRGAFYQGGEDEASEILRRRNIMGAKFADETNREVLPEYMQIRDMTKLGKSGRSKYKDLRSEDTGRWGQDLQPKRDRWPVDDRFAPENDRRRSGPERSGANDIPVAERHRRRRSRSRSRSRTRRRSWNRSRSRSRTRSRERRKRSRSPPFESSRRDEKRLRGYDDR